MSTSVAGVITRRVRAKHNRLIISDPCVCSACVILVLGGSCMVGRVGGGY